MRRRSGGKWMLKSGSRMIIEHSSVAIQSVQGMIRTKRSAIEGKCQVKTVAVDRPTSRT